MTPNTGDPTEKCVPHKTGLSVLVLKKNATFGPFASRINHCTDVRLSKWAITERLTFAQIYFVLMWGQKHFTCTSPPHPFVGVKIRRRDFDLKQDKTRLVFQSKNQCIIFAYNVLITFKYQGMFHFLLGWNKFEKILPREKRSSSVVLAFFTLRTEQYSFQKAPALINPCETN